MTRSTRVKTTALLILALVAASVVDAAALALYTFEGNSLASSDTEPLTIASSISNQATGSFSGDNNSIQSENISAGGATQSLALAFSARAINNAVDAFYQFTVQPAVGTLAIDFDQLTFDAKVFDTLSGSTGFSYNLYWDVDAFASSIAGPVAGPIILATDSPSESDFTSISMDLSSLPAVSGPVVFRLEPIFSPSVSKNGATGQRRGSFDNLALIGTATDASGGGAMGDPHIKKWNGEFFDYHAQCDSVLLKTYLPKAGLKLDIHLRTTITGDWSFIDTFGLRVGDDVLEVSRGGHMWLNGEANPKLPIKLAGIYPVTYIQANKAKKHAKWHITQIDFGEGQIVTVKSFLRQKILNIMISGAKAENFKESLGLMGAYGSGIFFGRDGATIHKSINDFGQEWQVNGDYDDPMLFHTNRAPQWPQKCVLPTLQTKEERKLRHGRRLGQVITEEDAEMACAHWPDDEKSMCIFDIIASGDLTLAVAGSY